MAKNIIIFSDGTGQAGGLLPDERRSNVYKLYRATRCGPDSSVDPREQLAFYDPGLGSAGDGDHIRIPVWRRIYNHLSQATGLGITRNIIDCYAYLVRHWEPGDRIFLFGFSRGAYTVRMLGGVLSLCGVPTTENGAPLRRDQKTALRIAREAVKDAYKHGAGLTWRREAFKAQRGELAQRFRYTYASNDETGRSNALPYFIGVWDTVATLGAPFVWQAAVGGILLLAVAALGVAAYALARIATWIAHSAFEAAWSVPGGPSEWSMYSTLIGAVAFLIAYFVPRIKYTTHTTYPWQDTLHLTAYRMEFYDTHLDPRVAFAKHALSIDEDRRDFDRVPWTDRGAGNAGKQDGWFEQIWFAGCHSDVGGSYPEDEARLSDISLGWMLEKAATLPHPLLVDRRYLNLFPDPSGMQHDERKASWLPWPKGPRTIPTDAPLHPTVIQRFKLAEVVHFDEMMPYRPDPLRHHKDVSDLFETTLETHPERVD